MTFRDCIFRARELAEQGLTLDEIDTRVIEPSDLSDEEKAAVWLYAHAEVEEYVSFRRLARRIYVNQLFEDARDKQPVGGD